MRDTGAHLLLTYYAKTCISSGGVNIYAKPIDSYVKEFTAWDKDEYMVGKPGDYLAVRTDDYHDVYIVDKTFLVKHIWRYCDE